MAIKSNIVRKDALSNSVDSGKNPKTLADREAFQKYLRSDQAYKAAYYNYDEDKKGFAKEDEEYEAWLKNNGITLNPVEDKEMMMKYTEKYFPEYLADLTEYYAGFNAKPSTSASTQKMGQTYVPEAWKSTNANKSVEGIAPPNMNTDASNYEDMDQYYADLAAGKINAKGEVISSETDTSTDTSTDMSEYSQANAAHDFLMKLFESYNNDINASRNELADRMWQMIESYSKENPLETDYGKAILDYYGVLGENSANAVNAATAGENAGNIDSFAAANAERQRLSRYGQGVETITGMSSERFQNMISALDSIGVNTNALFETQGKYGVDPARQYATDLYTTDASSTAAYNELMAQLEGNTTNTTVLDNDAVISALKNAYSNLNVIGGDSEEIDWTATDAETWKEAIEALKTNSYYSGLTDDYLNALVAQIMKGTQAETTAETETNPNMVDISKLPAWIRNLYFPQASTSGRGGTF